MSRKSIYLTVDVECHDIDKLNLYIYGNKNNHSYGLKQILEIGKEYNLPINFFLDIVEYHRYGEKYIKDIVDLIDSYNQPILFHFHPNYVSNNDEKSFLWQYSKDEMSDLLSKGLQDYYKFVGESNKVIYRAGRYGANHEMYEIMGKMGVDFLDLSYCYGSGKMCHLSYEELGSYNLPKKFQGVTILPNTFYVGMDYFKKKKVFNLNVSESSYFEFKKVINRTKLNNVVYTMHSWDLIRKYFFTKKHFWLDSRTKKRLIKTIKYARDKGFEFKNLNDFTYTPYNEADDELLNICKTPIEKISSLFVTFFKFMKIGRLNKKYFVFYNSLFAFIFLILLGGIICLILFI